MRHFFNKAKAPDPVAESCNHEGCQEPGIYPAPKDRSRLRERIWLCLEHVREYNAGWNYFAGMNEGDMYASWRKDITWDRPTWPFGQQTMSHNFFNPEAWVHIHRFFDHKIAETLNKSDPDALDFKPNSPEGKALRELDLTGSVSSKGIKQAYKSLVKRFHPDTNNGCKIAEEKLKSINNAYATLKAKLG